MKPLCVPLLSLSLLAFAPGELLACNGRRPAAGTAVSVRQVNATTWNLFVPGYRTKTIGLGIHFCAAGFRRPSSGPITGVVGFGMFKESDGGTLPGFRWSSSAPVAAAWNRVAAGSWSGLLGEATGPSAGGVDNMLVFSLSVTNGTTLAQLTAALKSSTIAIDEATARGDLTNVGRHQFKPTVVTEQDVATNPKMFYNTSAQTSASTRATTSAADEIYFMQPIEFRRGQGAATGWSIVLQDQNGSTSESIQMGYVKYAGTKPDLTASGSLTNVTYHLFGTGTGVQAFLYTLTTVSKVPVGEKSGIRITLAKPRSTSDLASIHTQDGTSLKIPAGLRKQWTFVRVSASALPYRTIGTTLRCGGLYDNPVLGIYTKSTAYGTATNLSGPEALYPDSARSDEIGFKVEAQRFAGAFALVLLAVDYRTPIVTTPFKQVLITDFVDAGFPFALDAKGRATTTSVPVPKGLKFAAQAICFKFKGASFDTASFTDAAKVSVQ